MSSYSIKTELLHAINFRPREPIYVHALGNWSKVPFEQKKALDPNDILEVKRYSKTDLLAQSDEWLEKGSVREWVNLEQLTNLRDKIAWLLDRPHYVATGKLKSWLRSGEMNTPEAVTAVRLREKDGRVFFLLVTESPEEISALIPRNRGNSVAGVQDMPRRRP